MQCVVFMVMRERFNRRRPVLRCVDTIHILLIGEFQQYTRCYSTRIAAAVTMRGLFGGVLRLCLLLSQVLLERLK